VTDSANAAPTSNTSGLDKLSLITLGSGTSPLVPILKFAAELSSLVLIGDGFVSMARGGLYGGGGPAAARKEDAMRGGLATGKVFDVVIVIATGEAVEVVAEPTILEEVATEAEGGGGEEEELI